MSVMITVENLAKTYVLHTQGGIEISVFDGQSLQVAAGECVTLHGPSGAGKSTLLRCLYGNCRPSAGRIQVRSGAETVELTAADPRVILNLRKQSLGYVSQFLRAIPRISALDVVAEPLRGLAVPIKEARERAGALLARLHIPGRLWSLAPATFSGGEQQRVNIARGFAANHPILLLDEPTASLDAVNRRAVIELILEAKADQRAIVGVFHDDEVREAVSTRLHLLKA